jgi:hypothetical protein
MKNIVPVLFILLLSSCCKRNIATVQQTAPVADTSMTDLKLKEATVIDYSEVDGCRFLLELANNEKLQPENLPAEYQKDKMKVQVKYHLTNKMTVCMAGKTVYIDFIKMKKE